MNVLSTLRIAAKMRTPNVYWQGDSQIQIGIRDWGTEPVTETVLDEITGFLRSREADVDITTPFERLSCYTDLQNDLRQALFLANEKVHTQLNSQIIHSGCEVICLAQRGYEIAYGIVGDFALFGLTKQGDIHLLVAQGGSQQSFLPDSLLGVDNRTHFVLGHLSVHDYSRLLIGSGDISLSLMDKKTYREQDLRRIVKSISATQASHKGLLLSLMKLDSEI